MGGLNNRLRRLERRIGPPPDPERERREDEQFFDKQVEYIRQRAAEVRHRREAGEGEPGIADLKGQSTFDIAAVAVSYVEPKLVPGPVAMALEESVERRGGLPDELEERFIEATRWIVAEAFAREQQGVA